MRWRPRGQGLPEKLGAVRTDRDLIGHRYYFSIDKESYYDAVRSARADVVINVVTPANWLVSPGRG